MIHAVEMSSGGTIYIPSLTTIVSGIPVIRGYYLNNLRDCSVGITDERDLRTIPVRSPQVE
jgi:hypothetical protein